MSVAEPDDGGLRDLIDGLGIEEPNVQSLKERFPNTPDGNRGLVARYQAVKKELSSLGVDMIHPSTEHAKELVSEHGAILVELHERHLR